MSNNDSDELITELAEHFSPEKPHKIFHSLGDRTAGDLIHLASACFARLFTGQDAAEEIWRGLGGDPDAVPLEYREAKFRKWLIEVITDQATRVLEVEKLRREGLEGNESW